jgi:hypothetical protein
MNLHSKVEKRKSGAKPETKAKGKRLEGRRMNFSILPVVDVIAAFII